MSNNVTAIIMLSGLSSRFGSNKLLLPFGEKKLCEHILDLAYHFNFYDVLVVYSDNKIKYLAEKRGFRCVYNTNAKNGMATSIKIGVNNANNNTSGYLFLSGDRPFLSENHINLIVESHKENKDKIIVPFFDDRSSSPCLFASIFKKELLLLEDNEIGKSVVKNNIESCVNVNFYNDIAALDIDTENDYKNALSHIISNATKPQNILFREF